MILTFPPSDIRNKAHFRQIVDETFREFLGESFDHDVTVNLKGSDRVIKFTADGYNKKMKIAYEGTKWIIPGDKNNNLTNPEYQWISRQDRRFYEWYKIGDTYLLLLEGYNSWTLRGNVRRFIRRLGLQRKNK
ncbi:MAG: hypothetical protein GY754_27485 [bacterium]|nr:hypothetical protein [bacterium]